MPLTVNRPFKDVAVCESTTSIATTPVIATGIAPSAGYVERVMAAAGGTTTGTIAVAVSINGGSDITGGALTIAAGSNARAASILEFPGVGTASGISVNEGDFITFTPSGGTGASIPGAFVMVIR
ncbi:hypothetical protein [Bradyrhizobium elkanii]|uniref:DUF2190 family protein n=2 Tax=Bradyrhizobium elkanii TaxID=29448 RepID=A0ABV4F0P7_BRAEL|nr:hypothetical protein [Bradyrhizobium elkanii]MCP1758026.1 hypothetical protein [Bradyrhizobium elkanii]MCP1983343.1 hypothetical protein [Bradyrhizobium elkanii]MCS3881677.1 hypothetical protein [Bradyrhizobium elkanii]MCS4218435.1 hypothetical protein [Bradyrhizobium elkanii]MCW2194299.1 hypothetical protein [Bradyrhizobium elkanii]